MGIFIFPSGTVTLSALAGYGLFPSAKMSRRKEERVTHGHFMLLLKSTAFIRLSYILASDSGRY